jgi:ABC-type sulfate/molybdate transport systems ATPase subunit
MIQARLRKSFPAREDSSGFSLDLEFTAAAGVTVLFGPADPAKRWCSIPSPDSSPRRRPHPGRRRSSVRWRNRACTSPRRRATVATCFRKYALFPHMTLRENLAFAVEHVARLERHRRVNESLEKFRLTESAGLRPHEVSGGQRQRCSIARALIGSPKILLLDEPSQGLDAPLRSELYDVLRQGPCRFQDPILLVTHDLDECFELGEEMLVLYEGRLVQSGPPRKILDQPANLEVARLLGAFNLLPARSARSIPAATPAKSASANSIWTVPTFRVNSSAIASRFACVLRSSRPPRATAAPVRIRSPQN